MSRGGCRGVDGVIPWHVYAVAATGWARKVSASVLGQSAAARAISAMASGVSGDSGHTPTRARSARIDG